MLKVGDKVRVIKRRDGFRFDTFKCCTKNIGKIGTITEIKSNTYLNVKLFQVFFENGYNVFVKDNTEKGENKGTYFVQSELKKVKE